MAFVLEDRVVETANNPGQGDFELLGATTNNRTFVAAIGNGNTTRYLAVGAEGAEIGVAQVQAGSPDRLLRPGTVKNLDGTTTPVNFTGTVTVACIASVEDVLWLGENGDLPARGGRDLGTDGDRWRNGYFSGRVHGNLSASDLNQGRVPSGRLSGDYSFDSLTLSDGLVAAAVRTGNLVFGGDNPWVIRMNDPTTSLRLTGGVDRDVGGNINLDAFGGGTLRSGTAARLTWGSGGVSADNGASGLHTVSTVESASNNDHTDYTIGTVILSIDGARSRNQSATIRLSGVWRFSTEGEGTVLSGTWRARGVIGLQNSDTLFQRVA